MSTSHHANPDDPASPAAAPTLSQGELLGGIYCPKQEREGLLRQHVAEQRKLFLARRPPHLTPATAIDQALPFIQSEAIEQAAGAFPQARTVSEGIASVVS